MKSFKVRNFEQDNQGEEFPSTVSLTQDAVAIIREKLVHLIGLQPEIDDLSLINFLWKKSVLVTTSNAEMEGFNFADVIKSVGVRPNQSILVNWDRMITVDRIQFGDFCKYFEYIWYPSSDDIEVFDDSFSWMVFIHHSGDIRIAKFAELKP